MLLILLRSFTPIQTHQSKRLTRSRNHDIPLFLHLSVEHSGFWFERDPEKAIQLLQLHSGGKVSKALAMAMKTATGDPVLEITPSAVSDANDVRRNARWAPKGTTHFASPNQETPVMSAVSSIPSPMNPPKVQATPPASPEQPVRITVGQQGSDDDQYMSVNSPKPPTPVQSRSKMTSPQQSPVRTTISPPTSPPSHAVATTMSPPRSPPPERTRSTDSPSLSRHSHDTNDLAALPKPTFSWGGQGDETLLRPNPSAQRILDVTVDSFVDSVQEHDQAIEDMLMEEFGSSVEGEEESVNRPIPAVDRRQQQGYHDDGSRAATAQDDEEDESPFILRAKTDEDAVRQASDDLWAEEEALLKADVKNARQVAQKYSQKSEEEQTSLDSPRTTKHARLEDEALQKADKEARIRAAQLEEYARTEAAIRQKEQEEEEERIKTSLVDQKIRSEIEARQKAEEAWADEKARRDAAARHKALEEARIQALQMEQAEKEAAARQMAEEEARIMAIQMEENARWEAEVRQKAEDEAKIKAKEIEDARREAEAQQKAEEEARIKAIQMEDKARNDAEARQKAEEEAKIKAIQMEGKARKDLESRQKAELEAQSLVTQQRAKWQQMSSTPQDNRKAEASPRPTHAKANVRDEEEEVTQDILNEFTKEVNSKDGSYLSSPRQSRLWDRPSSFSKQLPPQSPAQTPLNREKRQAPWTVESSPATPKSPTQKTEKELLTAPYADIAKNKREKEELERQQAEDAFNKAQQAKEAERLQKIQRLEEERKRMRKEEQQRASEEKSRSAASENGSSGATAATRVAESETPVSSDRFVLLISGSSGNPLQKVNQGRVLAMLEGKNLTYITVDGANPAEVDRRNQFFNLSGIRGKYPQLFLEQQGRTSFVGDYDAIDDLNESGGLAKLLSPQRDNSSSSNLSSSRATPTAKVTETETPASCDKFVLLISSSSGNPLQKVNQGRVVAMLEGKKLPFISVDGANPAEVDHRNQLFNLSGMRGKYPQLFLEQKGRTTFVGDYDAIDDLNESRGLAKLLSPQQDNSSSSSTAADSVAATSSNEDELTVVNGKSMIVLLSKVSGNYTQKSNQERALGMLASNRIRPEIVDASDPSTVAFRNRLFGISGVRGNYPQFFLKHVETGEFSYVGNFNTIEGVNDQGPLEELFQ